MKNINSTRQLPTINMSQIIATDLGRGAAEIFLLQNGQKFLMNQRLLPQLGHFISVLACYRIVKSLTFCMRSIIHKTATQQPNETTTTFGQDQGFELRLDNVPTKKTVTSNAVPKTDNMIAKYRLSRSAPYF